ncbi:MAG: radical SAM protein [Bacteroidia bacterium]|nr:MAG: radical SAM protein [Bacteroidia bacterium]
MNGFLFEQIVFGPVKSRRLGISLGINLLPLNQKHCTFNCLYCECGWTLPDNKSNASYPARSEVYQALELRLRAMKQKKSLLDTITFAGNGEPTLHPEFAGIIDDTIILRNSYYPEGRIAVLSNASLASEKEVAEALKKVDQNILKLDAGTNETFRLINNPAGQVHLDDIVENLKQFSGNLIIQTLFVRGTHKGVSFDNTTDHEVSLWLQHIQMLQPKLVMIYPIARATPTEDVEKVPGDELLSIAARVEALGIPTEVYP